MKTVVRLVSTFFYIGYIPKVSGTAGSLGGLLFFLLVSYSFPLTVISLLALTAAALLVVGKAEELFGKKDSRRIVIDEAIGMMISLLLLPKKPLLVVAAFILFRLFDIIKPFPIRRIERTASPWGVILDDVVAGIYANLAAQFIAIFALKSGV